MKYFVINFLLLTLGLCIRTKLQQELPEGKFKIDLAIKEGSHSTADEITKQINDKERVAAALENPNLRQTVNDCIAEEETRRINFETLTGDVWRS